MSASILSAPTLAQPFSAVQVSGTGPGADGCTFSATCNGQVVPITSTNWTGTTWAIEFKAPACVAEMSNQITVTVDCGEGCQDSVDIPIDCP